ncbi:MAG: hypothetical protein V4717_18735 [Bacteroidota bacterium]
MKKFTILFCWSLLVFSTAKSQSVAISGDNSVADPSAILDVKSTSKGLLVPRMDFGLRNLIGAPATGLLIYQTNNTPGFYYHTGLAWTPLLDNMGNHIMTKNLTANSFYLSKTGSNFGIQLLDKGGVSIRTSYTFAVNTT